MKNNKGFSYVEFILVIGIMAVLVSMVSISMGLVSRTNVNRGAEKLNSSINRARNMAMAKGTDRSIVKITFDGTKYYCYVGSATGDSSKGREEIAMSPVTIGYSVQGGSSVQLITTTNPLVLKFDQSTGAFKAMSDGKYVTKLVFTNSDKTASITLYPETGKTEIGN